MKLLANETAQNDGNDVCALILCAGQGTRTGLCYNKILHYIGKKTVLEMTVERFRQSKVSKLFLAIAQTDEDKIKELIKPYADITLIYGGETRTESVRRGLSAIGNCSVVVIHDGARPYVSADIINNSIDSAMLYGSGVAAVQATDSIKEVCNNSILRTLPRDGLYHIQTPQTFRYTEITDAYCKITGVYNDDSEVYAKAGYTPRIVPGDYGNNKVTSANDLFCGASSRTKIGVGFDVHCLEDGRPLILGGIKIYHTKGLQGHSDADVLTHAVMDALLSAANLPDIGVLFPNTNYLYKGISSIKLLSSVIKLVLEKGFTVGNISGVIMAEKPKLAGYIGKMRNKIAGVAGITLNQVNFSATTTEKLGIIGDEKGIAASSACLLFF